MYLIWSVAWFYLAFTGLISHSDPQALTFGESRLVYEWTSLDLDWASEAEKQEAVNNGSFVAERNLVAGIKLYKGEVYLTIPRWRYTSGQPATLLKVVKVNGEPKLRPYPDWASQKQGDCRALQYVQSMEIDPNTGRMYVIDAGRVGLSGQEPVLNVCPAKIVVYDLNSDTKIDSYELDEEVVSRNNSFLNDIVLDYVDGVVRYAYITDVIESRLHVYDFKSRKGYNLEDPSMKPEFSTNGTVIRINNTDYTFNGGLDGIAMCPDFEYVYYCPLGGYNLYQVPTSSLRAGTFGPTTGPRLVGRKLTQTDGLAHGNRRLYFGMLGLSAVYFWDSLTDIRDQNSSIDKVMMKTQVKVVEDVERMQWPDTFAFDDDGWLWFVSNRLHLFSSRTMDFTGKHGANVRVWKVFVNETGYLHQADARTRANNGSVGTKFNRSSYLRSSYLYILSICFALIIILGLK
ncbi:protein yellow-like [Physella acuta]|uniref:protein yellow-like n=1 Tax=Physella acuta TaxID=109671 RepID=UPI0027DB7561|nr:protein yellow-like [Physella acuta]